MSDCFAFLAKLCGKWNGPGVNHEQQSYRGEIIFDEPINKSAITFRSVATGFDGSVYHSDKIIVGADLGGATVAYGASNNLPGLWPFSVMHTSPGLMTFTLGDLNDQASFREIITIRLEADGRLFHGFAWAMLDEAMQERSSALLSPVR